MKPSPSRTPGERLAAIFRVAAEEVRTSNDFHPNADVSVCMCDALFHNAKAREYADAKDLLNEIFGFDAIKAGPEIYRWGKNFGDMPSEIRCGREVALLFLAEMIEAGDA